MKKSILGSFRDKKFRYGGYAALIVAIVIVLLVVLNLLVGLLPWKLDLTPEKLYSLSDQTHRVLDRLDTEVTIYGLAQPGRENPILDEVIRRYEARTKNITLEYVDPYRNPSFPQKYEEDGETPSENHYIVVSGDKFKVISPFDMYNYRYNPNNPYETQAESLKIEQALTGAVLYVTGEQDPVIYQLVGHREYDLPPALKEQIESENYIFKSLSLLTEEQVPIDANVLLVVSPKLDLTSDEVEKLRDFLFNRRGNAIFLLDIVLEEQPNLNELLKSYGVELERVLIFEMDPNHAIPQLYPGLVPEQPYHAITASLRRDDMQVLLPFSQAIQELEIKRRTIEIEPLLSTTDKSFGKVDIQSQDNLKRSEDLDGPFDVAVAITDAGERDQAAARAVILGSSALLYPEQALGRMYDVPGNTNFFLNSLNWVRGQEDLISIRPKSLFTMGLIGLNQLKYYIFAGVVVILIPLIVLGSGLVVWLKRRHL